MNIEQEIKQLKEQYSNDKIEKAKCEARLEDLEKKKDEVLKKCDSKGIKPEELATKIDESNTKLKDLITKAKELLPGAATGVDEGEGYDPQSPNAPF